ncbi:hypothetical protein [Paraburkholderia diazotrophica]|uniref:hypothetical protein n=1 Tax=Paraburkholderia diazotrophica TaxID=667676 RepID=UPI0031829D78
MTLDETVYDRPLAHWRVSLRSMGVKAFVIERTRRAADGKRKLPLRRSFDF